MTGFAGPSSGPGGDSAVAGPPCFFGARRLALSGSSVCRERTHANRYKWIRRLEGGARRIFKENRLLIVSSKALNAH